MDGCFDVRIQLSNCCNVSMINNYIPSPPSDVAFPVALSSPETYSAWRGVF